MILGELEKLVLNTISKMCTTPNGHCYFFVDKFSFKILTTIVMAIYKFNNLEIIYVILIIITNINMHL